MALSKVRVFSTPSCVYCTTLKEYLKKNKIKFEDIDVSQDDKALDEMVEKSGQMNVPVIDIDGTIINGFDKKVIDGLLKIK
ncbi:MAG: glutaredoxin domain-containing protein [Candidatus Staskawiczbacteria bacterium]|jgi:glutaredoxin-like YruB-family protein